MVSKSLFVMFLTPGDNQGMIRDNLGKQETKAEECEKKRHLKVSCVVAGWFGPIANEKRWS